MNNIRFITAAPVCDDLFVDREEELQKAVDWFISGKGNLIISGERGIGKTSLAKKAAKVSEEKIKDTMILVNSIYPYYGQSFDAYISELGKHITIRIWELISKKPFSELFSESLDFEERKIEKKDIKTLRRIYNILSASQLSSKFTKLSKIGGKLIIDAGTQEGLEKEMLRTSITSFEFLAILDELKAISSQYDFPRILVIVDEFNYLPKDEQSDFIRTYFQLLNARSILFGLIGIDLDPWSIPGLFQSVESHIPLGPFESPQYVQDLVMAARKGTEDAEAYQFLCTDKASQIIYDESKGNPRRIQEFCYTFMSNLKKAGQKMDLSQAFEAAKRQAVENSLREAEMERRFRNRIRD